MTRTSPVPTASNVDERTLLTSTDEQLDALFRASPPGPVPAGVLDGVAILAAGRSFTRPIAAVVRAVGWRGKVVDPDGAGLENRVGPLGVPAVRALVRRGESLVDGAPCVVLDYSTTSVVARSVRDEIRLVAPHLYLGVVWFRERRVGWFTLRERGRSEQSAPSRVFAKLAVAVDQRRRWDRFPTPVAVTLLKGIRDNLRARNLYDTNDEESLPKLDSDPAPRWLVARTPDGSYNDLSSPAMGMAGTRFGRNVPLHQTWPEQAERLMAPNPRLVSTALLARGAEMIPATTLNVIAAAWLQFETRDWFSHTTELAQPFEVPRPSGDSWPADPILLPRTERDPRGGPETPATFVNTETHWWDASQVYGSTEKFQRAVRKPALGPGKVAIRADGLVDVEPSLLGSSGGQDGWWVGLELLHTVFMREHNAVCDMLHAAYPSWSDDQVFDKARLVVAALTAKIHTVEWTTAILGHPALQIGMRANWFGIAGERVRNLIGRLSESESISGIPGSPTDHHSAPFSITEEFVAVYRMHPLVPDDFDIRSIADPHAHEAKEFLDLAGQQSRSMLEQFGAADLFYTLGTAHPGAVTLHNHPRFMQRFRRHDDMEIDLAAVDILRSRERGVPRYNQFRRLLHLPPAESFEDLTKDRDKAAEIAAVYGSIEDVDLTVGLHAEPLPSGFGFSDTAFRTFILMASRRLKSDRFFTTDFTPEVYTPEGIRWIADNDMSAVLVRHYPDLAPVLRTVRNPFAQWPVLDRRRA
jgi:heme peroxidase